MAGAGQSRAAASAPSTAAKDRYMSVISHNSQQVTTSLFFLQFLGPTIPQDLHIFHKIDLLTGEK